MQILNRTSNSIAPVGIIFQLADGKIQGCNKDAETILGYEAKTLIATPYSELPWHTIHENGSVFPVQTHPASATLQTGQPLSDITISFSKPNGSLIWLSLDTQPLFQGNGELLGVMTSFKDITSQQNNELTCFADEVGAIADRIPGVLYLYDTATGQNIYLNSQTYSSIGYETAEILAMGANFTASVMHPEDLARLSLHIEKLSKGRDDEVYKFEYRMRHKNSQWRWFCSQERIYSRNEDGSVWQIIGIARDISERKKLEAQLTQTNSILQSIIGDTSDLIFVKDLQGRYVVVNQAAADWVGMSVDEILGQDDTALFEPEIVRSIREREQQVIAEQKAVFYEEKIPTGSKMPTASQGEWRSLLTNKYPWRDEGGNLLGIIGICRDITEIKESQRKLQENQELLRLALSSAKAGSWDWEIATGKITWSPENYELHGIDPKIQPLGYQHWENSIHQEDIQLIRQEVQRVLSSEISEFRSEFRIIHPQKGVRWLLHIGNLTCNSQGQPVRLSGINLDITKSKKTEEKLRNSEQQLRRVIDSLYSFVGVLTPNGVLIEANRTALEAANLAVEDVVNKPFDQTYWWSYSTQVQSQLRTAIAAAASGKKVRYDVTVRIGTEKYLLIDFSIVPLLDNTGKVQYLIPSGIDITDREASKQALQQSQQELKLITEVVPQQIWTTLPDGTIDYINQRWQDYTGVSLPQLQQHGWETIAHPEDLSRMKKSWHHVLTTGENYNLKARLRSKKGVYSWFLCRARPLRNERGQIIKWYGTNTSITRIVELEEKLRARTADLVQANQLKDEFLAIVSHELRTPLNPILGWSQLIATGSLDAQKTAVAIEVIQRNAQLQVQLINDLLDVSRILRGKLKLELIPLNLATVIRHAIATVQLTAQAKSIEIVTELEPNIGLVAGDANRLQQVVWNILSNAIKFTPDGGLVTVRLKRIEPDLASSSLQESGVSDRSIADAQARLTLAQIEIEDTGIGIEPEFLPYVFERFRQAESGNTRKFGGLGLGLAIADYLTELHRGTVTVESEGQNRGTTFRVTLPLANSFSTKINAPKQMKESTIQNCLAGTHVLVIDDEVDSLELLTLVFQQEGANTIAVASANEALEAIDKVTVDIIISDIGMPKTDGYTLMNQIRSLPEGKQIPAIALTAYAGEIDRQRSLDAGFQHHIAKPLDIDLLLDITIKLLSDRD